MTDSSLSLNLPDLDADVLRNLCGANNRILKRVEGEFCVTLSGQAGAWQVEGDRAAEAVAAMQALLAWARRGPLEDVQVEGILRHGRNEMHQAAEGAEGGDVLIAGRRRIQGKTPNQRRYLESIQSHVLTIGVGPAGTGKTYLAEALVLQACRLGYRARKVSQDMLMEEVRVNRAMGKYVKYLKDLDQTSVLVIDDFAIGDHDGRQYCEILNILEERIGKNCTIITSQYPGKSWHERIPDPTVADAICDRLLMTSWVLPLKGPSQRTKPS